MFETGFTNRNSVHKDCQGGIQIQYNIFQSDEYYVNLIDKLRLSDSFRIQTCSDVF